LLRNGPLNSPKNSNDFFGIFSSRQSVSLLQTHNVIYASSKAGSFSTGAVGAGSIPSSLCHGPKKSWQSATGQRIEIYWSSLAWNPRFLIQSKLDLIHWFGRASSRYNESTTSACREPFRLESPPHLRRFHDPQCRLQLYG
jgi:hypothetical protein